jgi:5'-3' exonuclease
VYGLARKWRTNVPRRFGDVCDALVRNGVKPSIVFDGEPDAERLSVRGNRTKQRAVRTRQLAMLTRPQKCGMRGAQLTRQLATPMPGDILRVKQIAKERGLPVLMATGEADALCSSLARADGGAAASTDTDLLAHGAPLVIYDLCPVTDRYWAWSLSRILEELSMTPEQFREMCALLGNDTVPRAATASELACCSCREAGSLIALYENGVKNSLAAHRRAAAAYATW